MASMRIFHVGFMLGSDRLQSGVCCMLLARKMGALPDLILSVRCNATTDNR